MFIILSPLGLVSAYGRIYGKSVGLKKKEAIFLKRSSNMIYYPGYVDTDIQRAVELLEKQV